MTIEELDVLIADKTWEDFANTGLRGELSVISPANRHRRIVFKMRVGMFLMQPHQAIIAEGQFIRMRLAPEYQSFKLKVLDAEYPDKSLYEKVGSRTKSARPGLLSYISKIFHGMIPTKS